METFTVRIINPNANNTILLRYGDRYTARQGQRVGRYDILFQGEWVSIDADYASVVDS